MKLPPIDYKKHPFFNCGNPNCAICSKAYSFLKIKTKITTIKDSFPTDAIAPFVGRFSYPNISMGILAPPQPEEDSSLYDAPRLWSSKNFTIPRIIDFRSSLINSRTSFNIKAKSSFLDLTQEIAMSSKPVNAEIKLREKPKFRLNLSSYIAPTGPRAALKKATLTQNPKIPRHVEKVFSDTDLKATDALVYLYKKNFDENFLSRLLSVGSIGLKPNRKLVPTRWGITATDDTLSRSLIEEIKNYPEANPTAYFGSYLGNHYLLLFFPAVWSYELFETYAGSKQFCGQCSYMTDYEPYGGRRNYAAETAGGYYTVRLAVAEKLKQLKRQASVLALRFITADYTLPLGVWVTREAARKALQSRPIEFSSQELMLAYARKLIKKKFNYDADVLLAKSILLRNIIHQVKLSKFI
jgi:hypothetical protein